MSYILNSKDWPSKHDISSPYSPLSPATLLSPPRLLATMQIGGEVSINVGFSFISWIMTPHISPPRSWRVASSLQTRTFMHCHRLPPLLAINVKNPNPDHANEFDKHFQNHSALFPHLGADSLACHYMEGVVIMFPPRWAYVGTAITFTKLEVNVWWSCDGAYVEMKVM